MMSLTVEQLTLPRYLTPDTDPLIVSALDLYEEVLPEGNYGSPHNRRSLTIPLFEGSIPFITRENDRVLALANLDLATQKMKDSAFLEAMVVHESARGKNVGRFTIEELAKIVAERGLKTIRTRSLESAIGFYAKLGFVCDEIVPKDPREPFMSLSVQ